MEGYPIILGNYEFIAPIAEGGFGQVYLARMGGAAGFSRTVAVKRIRPEYTSSPSFVSDFIKEARIGGMLTHHNVVQVLGFEEIQGQYFLIMEYVDGVGLDYVIRFTRKRGETLPLSIVAEIIAQAAEGLHYVHSLKHEDGTSLRLVHRDLKPSNLMISRLGVVKITDFGVARAAIEVGMKTQAGLIKGTLAYLSPEQARDEALDSRSDLYSLGAILYELLTLRRLYPNESVFTTLEALGHNEVGEPLKSIPAEAEVFLPLLRGLLTARPEDRIATGGEVARQAREVQLTLTTTKVSLTPFADRWIEARQAELTLKRVAGAGEGQSAPPPEETPADTGEAEPAPGTPGPVSSAARPVGADRALPEGGPPRTRIVGETATPAGTGTEPTPPPEDAGPLPSHDTALKTKRIVAAAAAIGTLLAMILVWVFFLSPPHNRPQTQARLEVPSPQAGHSDAIPPPQPPAVSTSTPAGAGDRASPSPESPAQHAVQETPAVKPRAALPRGRRVRRRQGDTRATSVHKEPEPGTPQADEERQPPEASKAGTPPPAPADAKRPTPQPKPATQQPPGQAETARKAPPASERVQATLIPGRLTVTSRPSALLYLDGQSIGETPLRGRQTPPGTYTLRLSRPDLEFHQQTRVTIEAGKEVRVMCTQNGCDVVTHR